MGRPSGYSPELADEICDRITEGESIYQLCRSDHMPHYTTVWRWLDTHDDFASKCARARELQAEFMDHKIMEVAENCGKDDAYAAKVKIAAYQWRAMKLAPKKYGDRLDQYIKQETTVRTVSDTPADLAEEQSSWVASHGNGYANGANGKAKGNGNGHL